jgi:hypothetical protein
MWYVVSFLVGAGLMWVYREYFHAKVVEPGKPPVVDGLRVAVEGLHKALFMGAGTVVVPMFNAMWRAAGLAEKGVPDIQGGRT